jgi:hypothetical protein
MKKDDAQSCDKQNYPVIAILILFLLSILGMLYNGPLFQRPERSPSPAIDSKLIPVLNQAPKYYIILKGHIDSSLQPYFKLKWNVAYYGMKSICPQVLNEVAGIVAPQQEHEIFITRPDKRGNYSVKIYLDKYLPGYCHWAMGSILYEVLGTLDQGIIYFSREKIHPYKNKTKIDVVFRKNQKKKKYEILRSGIPMFNDVLTSEIYDQDFYELEINLLEEKKHDSHA